MRKSALFAVIALAAAGSAAAADYTIRVPVNVGSIPVEVKKGAVVCGAYKVAGSPTSYPWSLGNRVGQGMKEFTLTNGGFGGTVEVAFSADPGSIRSDAHAYACSLNLLPPSGVYVDCGSAGSVSICEHQSGMNAAYWVSGPITW